MHGRTCTKVEISIRSQEVTAVRSSEITYDISSAEAPSDHAYPSNEAAGPVSGEGPLRLPCAVGTPCWPLRQM